MSDPAVWDTPGEPTPEIVAALAAHVGDAGAADLAARIYELAFPSFREGGYHSDFLAETPRGAADEAELQRRIAGYEVPGKPGVIRYAHRRARMELIAEWLVELMGGQGGCSDVSCPAGKPASTRPPSSPRRKRASKPAAGCQKAG